LNGIGRIADCADSGVCLVLSRSAFPSRLKGSQRETERPDAPHLCGLQLNQDQGTDDGQEIKVDHVFQFWSSAHLNSVSPSGSRSGSRMLEVRLATNHQTLASDCPYIRNKQSSEAAYRATVQGFSLHQQQKDQRCPVPFSPMTDGTDPPAKSLLLSRFITFERNADTLIFVVHVTRRVDRISCHSVSHAAHETAEMTEQSLPECASIGPRPDPDCTPFSAQ